MVFESIIAYFLDKYLSNYIDNFDSSMLKIGIWNGDVVLENLYLKSNALDELNLPIKVVFGHLKKLRLKIPWKSLYHESVKASIDGLTILVAPASSVSYDPANEKKEQRDKKLKELNRLIELEKEKEKASKSRSDGEKGADQDTFTERLQMQILRNIELQISNIHIRYEDEFSKPEHPFSAGFTLDSIGIKTVDENWQPTYLKDEKILVNKLVKLISLAIYCNSDDTLLNKESKEDVIPKLQGMIGTDTVNMSYVLNPMSLITQAVLNMKPKQDNYRAPMFDFTILLESIGIELNRLQYFDIMDMLGTIDLMVLNAKYHKYKPAVALRTDTVHKWWKFACTAIVETKIRPRINQWKWESIKRVTQTRRDYVKLLRRKLTKKGAKLSAEEKELEVQYEEILDVFNLALARRQAEVEHARVEEESAKGSWWGWATAPSTKMQKQDKEKIKEAVSLSKEEKLKLFDAIGYTGEETYSEYPSTYVNLRVKFLLKKFEVSLKNGEYKSTTSASFVSQKNLLHLLVENMELNLFRRPVDNGFKVTSSIKSILITGSSVNSLNESVGKLVDAGEPVLVEPDMKDQDFMNVEFEQNPIEATGFKRLKLKSKSLRLTYHAITINNIVYFFRSERIGKLKFAALKKISEAKERSVLYMKNNLDHIQQLDLNIDVKPSYVVIPEQGVFSENSKSICISFGQFTMKSESNFKRNSLDREISQNDSDSFHSADEEADPTISPIEKISPLNDSDSVIQASYYKFQIKLKNVQVCLTNSQHSFQQFTRSLQTGINSDNVNYILTPLDLFFNIHQCVYADDVKLPGLKVFGGLPLISIEMTNKKLEHLIQIATSIPVPESSTRPVYMESNYADGVELDGIDGNEGDDVIDQLNILDTTMTRSSTSSSSFGQKDKLVQQTVKLELAFEITQIYFKLSEDTEDTVKYFDYITFKIVSFGTFVQVKTYDRHAQVYLNYIECEYGLLKDTNGSRLYLIRSDAAASAEGASNRLVDVHVTATDADSPTLELMHDKVLTRVEVSLSAVDFVLNFVALGNVMRFVEVFRESLVYTKTEVVATTKAHIKQKYKKVKANLKEEHIVHLVNKAKSSSLKKSATIQSSIADRNLTELKLSARMAGVSARVATTTVDYFQLNVTKLDATVLTQPANTQINLVLNSISVQDLQATSQYRNIVSLKENTENLITVQLTLLNAPKAENASDIADVFQREKFYFKNYLDPEHFDLVVKANISKLRFMFLMKHLNTLLNLVRIVSDPLPKRLEKQQKKQAKKEAKREKKAAELTDIDDNNSLEVNNSFSFIYRVKLDVTVNAPIIILPFNGQALLLDCGLITVLTNQEILTDYYKDLSEAMTQSSESINERCRLPPLNEVQQICLSNMIVSRASLEQDLSVHGEVSLVDCSDLFMKVKRSYQPNVYKRVEALNVDANYKGLLVSLSRSDYTFLITLALSFGEKEALSDPDLNVVKSLGEDSSSLSRQQEQALDKQGKEDVKEQTKLFVVSKSKTSFKNESLLFKFNIESIKMYLHDEVKALVTDEILKRSPSSAMAMFELNTLKFEFNLKNNTEDTRDNMKVKFLLDNIILDDTRPTNKRPIRLIERYHCKQVVKKAMIYCSYEQKATLESVDGAGATEFLPEKRVSVILSCLRMCVNVDYLITLYDFFVEGLPLGQLNSDKSKAKVSKAINKLDEIALGAELIQQQPTNVGRFFCDVRIETPQFILYENQFDLKRTNCLIIDGLINLKLSTVDNQTKVYLELNDLMVKLKSFKKKKYETRNSYLILTPTSVSLTGQIDNNDISYDTDRKHQSFICDFQEINLNMCSLMINTSLKMLNSITSSLAKRFPSSDSTPVLVDSESANTWTSDLSLFNPVAFTASDFWFTQYKNNGSMSSSSTCSDLSVGSTPESGLRANKKTQLLIRTRKILIKLEAGTSEEIPLIALNLSMTGEVSNWLVSPTLGLKINLEMSYFNEALTAWEPVIEPVEDANDNLRPYELALDMFSFRENSEVGHRKAMKKSESSRELDKHSNNLKVVRSFQVTSETSLQFVVTRTFMGLIDTVVKTLTIGDEVNEKAEGELYEDKTEMEMEENLIMENLRAGQLVEEDELQIDEDDENLSFGFLIKNELGFDVQLESLFGFKFYNFDRNMDSRNLNEIKLGNDQSYPIMLQSDFMSTLKSSEDHSPSASEFDLQSKQQRQNSSSDQLMTFKVTMPKESSWGQQVVNVNNATVNGYYLTGSRNLLLCETVAILDKRRIRLRSQIQVINTMEFDILVSYPVSINEEVSSDYSASSVHWTDSTIKPGKKWCLPLSSLQQNQVDFFRIAPILNGNQDNLEMQTINWHSAANHKLLSFNNNDTFVQVIIEKEPIDVQTADGDQTIEFAYNILLLPTVTFSNLLPYSIKYKIVSANTTEEMRLLEAGETVKLYNAKVGSSQLLLEMDYAGTTWFSSHLIDFNGKVDKSKTKQEESNPIDFRSGGQLISLCYNAVLEQNCISFTLYSPFWLINQTKLKLDYKFKGMDKEVNEISETSDQPIFFKMNSKLFENQNKSLLVRVNGSASEWSSPFLIDAIGNNGTILCKPLNSSSKNKGHQKFYEIGVDIQLSSNNLTKIIKLSPYYLLVNSTELALDVVEVSEYNQRNEPTLTLEPNTITPFWPSNYSPSKKNTVRVVPWRPTTDTDINNLSASEVSAPFWYNTKHSTVLKFKDNAHQTNMRALFVECAPTERIIRTVFRQYCYGDAPVLVVNCLKNQPLSIKQNDAADEDMHLMPEQYFIKVWENPVGARELKWSCGLSIDQVYNLDMLQMKQKFQVTLSKDAYCLSFLDGLQKVLMFVDRLDNLNDEVAGFKEIKGDELILNVNSFSLSLIDDKNQREILYMSITSSSLNWGEKLNNKFKVFKALPTHTIEIIEALYQKYQLEKEESPENAYKTYMIDEEDEIDFSRMVMLHGKKEIPLERHFAPSVYANLFKSVNQTNLHLVVHKIQIDNQLYDTVFPVVFSKVLPPKSVTSSSIVKPIIEMCMVQSHSQRTHTSEVKYFKVLMQEFSVKLDIIFLNAIAEFFSQNKNLGKKKISSSAEFNKELYKIKRSSYDLFHYSLENANQVKTEKLYFDMCHISPIKIHLSFSLSGADAFKNSNILLDNPIFKSIGLVLTDMQDVVFKLGYFEIKNSAYSWKDLSNEATTHYTNQIIKQGYILVLGLDVLGNPFGLIRGLAEGVESLFYEPYAGFVQGPGEFAEGVALGIGKLFGNTLGGAAGALGKITGTLGKGLATLSFDKDYQNRRQKQAESKPTFVKNVGQNLVMGFVSGITGVVEKPIEGAKSGGAVGMFSGIGKGLLGAVTKPTAGIVDFTSQSFEGIRKVAVQEESVNRVRPPRRIIRLVTPYRLKEAQCIMILRDLDKGFFANQRFVACLIISRDPKYILIATNQVLLLVKDNVVFGDQSREWSYEYGELRCAPVLSGVQLTIHTKITEKKFFEKDRFMEKVLTVNDIDAAKKFLLRVARLMRDRA